MRVHLAGENKPRSKWPVGQAVKTPPFHGGNTGSSPVRVTTWRHSSAGRALASHARGHRFEFCCLHQNPEALRLQDFFIATRNGKRNEYGIGKGKRKTLEPKFKGFKKWRRRRDSNPRDPFGAYTISNRARSTKLRDFSVFALRFVVLFCFCVARAGQATMEIIAGFCQKSSPFLKKFKKVFPPSGKGKQRGR